MSKDATFNAEDLAFRRAMFKALTEARRAGEISFQDAQRVRIHLLFPTTLSMLRQAAELDIALAEERDPTEVLGLIDWDNIDPDKLKAILEAILAFILGLIDGIGGIG